MSTTTSSATTTATAGQRAWSRRDTDRLAAQQRLRAGIWFGHAGRLTQRCPECREAISACERVDAFDLDDPDQWETDVDRVLDEAVYDHLTTGACPDDHRRPA